MAQYYSLTTITKNGLNFLHPTILSRVVKWNIKKVAVNDFENHRDNWLFVGAGIPW